MIPLLDRLPGNGYKTLTGLAVMLLALVAFRHRVLDVDGTQVVFFTGLGLATAGAVHKVAKDRRRKGGGE